MRELNITSELLRVVLALIIGGIIGIERGNKNQPAGFRTYMLVCLGATIVMMTNQYICNYFDTGDPSRLGAQVVSGIGFLGAGTIIVARDNRVRGLTTAAGLWSVACIGIALGIGFYEGAVFAGLAILLVMTIFRKLDKKVHEHSRYLRLYLNFASTDALNDFMKQTEQNGIKVVDIQTLKAKKNQRNSVSVVLAMRIEQAQTHREVIQKIREFNGLQYLEEV